MANSFNLSTASAVTAKAEDAPKEYRDSLFLFDPESDQGKLESCLFDVPCDKSVVVRALKLVAGDELVLQISDPCGDCIEDLVPASVVLNNTVNEITIYRAGKYRLRWSSGAPGDAVVFATPSSPIYAIGA